mmetsp:Transcript_12609/g.18582  ORF Transcript_12609/g.18582 Transcript_12609/m.18582 type:complete len:213 (-) Transcript_12609:273-911(-)
MFSYLASLRLRSDSWELRCDSMPLSCWNCRVSITRRSCAAFASDNSALRLLSSFCKSAEISVSLACDFDSSCMLSCCRKKLTSWERALFSCSILLHWACSWVNRSCSCLLVSPSRPVSSTRRWCSSLMDVSFPVPERLTAAGTSKRMLSTSFNSDSSSTIPVSMERCTPCSSAPSNSCFSKSTVMFTVVASSCLMFPLTMLFRLSRMSETSS